LNVVMGYSQMLQYGVLGQLNPEQQRAVEKVIARSKDLLRMINEILQVTSIEAGKTKVEMQEIDLVDLLDDLRSSYEVGLEKDLAFNWDYSMERRAIRTDAEKLKHILQNLINNAIKFTDKGHVAVSVRCCREAKMAEFKVEDTGTGIEEDLLPSIFEKFRQLDSSSTRNHEGAGVGLYIVKKYTEMLGGKIHVESAVGKGSAFTVTLPLLI
jgi:two-component system cell cycle sensor histidine kinase PleC